MTTVRIQIPAPSSLLVANVIGLLGIAAVVVAIGGLAGVWWAALAGGVALVGLSLIGLTHATSVPATVADVGAATAASAPATVTAIGEQLAA